MVGHQRKPAMAGPPLRIEFAHTAPEHHRHEFLTINVAGSARSDEFSVAQNGDDITNLEYLAQTVRDVYDRLALALEQTQRLENVLDLDVGKRRCRFVEDEHASIPGQHAGDLDELTLSHSELGYRRIEGKPHQSDRVQRTPRRIAKVASTVEQRRRLVAEPNIVLNRQVRRQTELLRDMGDAEFLGVQRMAYVAELGRRG